MNKIRISLIICAIIGIIGEFFIIDFNELSWSKNAGSYIGIISMICLFTSMIISIKYDKKKSNKRTLRK